jgi:hypothetical protein
MANSNWSNAGHFYAPQVKPVLLNCSFIVDSTNGNGLGIRSLKGPGIEAVYMKTSATPASGNPNPASGVIVVDLAQNFQRYLGGFSGQVSPVTGAALTLSGAGLTVGKPYVITSLGSTTAAQWQTVGLPVGYTAAVGASFIALTNGTGLGSGTVKAVGISGISSIEAIGDLNLTIQGVAPSGPVGARLIFQCLAPTSSSVTTLVATAPTNESVISLSFYLSDSSVTVAGQ